MSFINKFGKKKEQEKQEEQEKHRNSSVDALFELLNMNLLNFEEFITGFYKKCNTSLNKVLIEQPFAKGFSQIRNELLSELHFVEGCFQLAIDSVTCRNNGVLLND